MDSVGNDWSGYAPEGHASSGLPELLGCDLSPLTSEDLSASRLQASQFILNCGEESYVAREDIYSACSFATQNQPLERFNNLSIDAWNTEIMNLDDQHIPGSMYSSGSVQHDWQSHAPPSSEESSIENGTAPQKRKGRENHKSKPQDQLVDRFCNLPVDEGNTELLNLDNQHIFGSTYSSEPVSPNWQLQAPPSSDPQGPSSQNGTAPPRRRSRKEPKLKPLKAWQWQPQSDQGLEAIRLRAVKARKQREATSTAFEKLRQDIDVVEREKGVIREKLTECQARVHKLEVIRGNLSI